MANRYAALYAIAKKMGLSNDDLHKFVYDATKKKSLKELDDCELAAVTARLRALKDNRENSRKSRNFTSGGNPATQKQRKKIYVLMKDMGWTTKRIAGLAKKLFDTDAIEWLTHAQCSDLIEALKSINARQVRNQSKDL